MGFIPSIAKLNSGVVKERVIEPSIFPRIGVGMEVYTELLIASDKFRYARKIFLNNVIEFVPTPLI